MVREDVPHMAPLMCANQGDTLTCVPSLVGHQPSSQYFAVDCAALNKLANDAAILVTVFKSPDVDLIFERDDGFSELDAF